MAEKGVRCPNPTLANAYSHITTLKAALFSNTSSALWMWMFRSKSAKQYLLQISSIIFDKGRVYFLVSLSTLFSHVLFTVQGRI